MTTLELSKKIKKDYVTVQNFCTKHDIKYNTYKGVVNETQTSEDIANILLKKKYITKKHSIYVKMIEKKDIAKNKKISSLEAQIKVIKKAA